MIGVSISLSLISSRRDKSYPPAHERTIDDGKNEKKSEGEMFDSPR